MAGTPLMQDDGWNSSHAIRRGQPHGASGSRSGWKHKRSGQGELTMSGRETIQFTSMLPDVVTVTKDPPLQRRTAVPVVEDELDANDITSGSIALTKETRKMYGWR